MQGRSTYYRSIGRHARHGAVSAQKSHMNTRKDPAFLFALALLLTGAWGTSSSEPAPESVWGAQQEVLDLATPKGQKRLAALAEQAHDHTLAYIDWTLKNAAASPLFAKHNAGSDGQPADEEICVRVEQSAARPGGYSVAGKPDPGNNHLLVDIKLDTAAGAPFARARCEYSEGAHALRIRGFYYVTNIGVPTAHTLEFTPLRVAPHTIPPSIRKFMR